MRDIRFFRFIIVALIFLACFSLEAKPEVSGAYNCFTILVGKDASSDGSVLLAHNEDDSGKNFFVNLHKVPAAKPDPYNRITLKNNGVVSQSKGAHGFLWLQIAGTEFGDTYLNEKGVVITSNGCLSREDKAVLSHGGIGIMLRRLMIERASSAREAVKIGGSLIEKYGYYSSGRSYAVADANEGWLLQVVKGKYWVA
ncbi:MAG: dipeptidase, partial [bacterium]|nr:dipeptidase [bacterium]